MYGVAEIPFEKSSERIEIHHDNEKSIVAHNKAVRDLIFVSPTILATGSYDNDFAIKLWEIPSFTLLQKLVGHKGKIRNLHYSQKMRILASSGDDCTVILWKRLAKKHWVLLSIIPGKEFMTWGILFDDSRKFLFTGCSHYIEIFHIKKNFRKIRTIQIRNAHVYAHHVIYSILKYDNRRILSADNEKIILWDYICGQKLAEINAHQHYIYRLKMFSYLERQYLISCSEDKFLKFWKVNKNKANEYSFELLSQDPTSKIAITGLEVIEKHGLIVLGLSSGIEGRGKMLILDCSSRRPLKEYIFNDIGEIGCLCVAWEPKKQHLVAGFWNGKIKLLHLTFHDD